MSNFELYIEFTQIMILNGSNSYRLIQRAVFATVNEKSSFQLSTAKIISTNIIF